MDERTVRLGALLRYKQRSQPREARGRAVVELLCGADIDPSAAEPIERQKTRAQLLNLEELRNDIGQDPKASRKLFEAVIEKDDTLPRRFLFQGEAAARPVGRIVIRMSASNIRYGTGSLVSRHLLLTNNHVIDSEDTGIRGFLELGYYELAPNMLPAEHQTFQIRPDKFFYTSEDLDYTLVGVENDNGYATTAAYGQVDLLSASGKALIGERVNIVQHSGGRPQVISIRENTTADVFDQWVHYTADTEPGSSGAAVFNDEWQLVALHHASVPTGRDAAGSLVNEGVRVSAIVDDLKRALS
ncbi:V8-like Glu-specific endopeptidase [Bradyrhizobium japonicum]